MKKSIYVLIGLIFLTIILNIQVYSQNIPAKVEVKAIDNGYQLLVNGKPFKIKGAGLEFGNIELLAANGANTFRTWRTENGKDDALVILDKAQKNGLMVLMGLEVGRERHGYDYNDTAWVKKQSEYIEKEVLRLKDHPALLGWAIGNELNLGAKNMKVFDAVNDLSKMIHKIDPNHPTTTPLSGAGKREIDYIKEHCSDLDFLSFQLYGGIVNLPRILQETGWTGPYMVTEWGATGHWEVPKTEWRAPIEQTSQEKAKAFIDRYKIAIESDPLKCIGSFVFIWGQKQERTPTWYGMLTEEDEITETVDAMQSIWTGKWPENRCPTIDSLRLNAKSALQSVKVPSGSKVEASAFVRDFEGDSLLYRWELLPESTRHASGGDHEDRPVSIFSKVDKSRIEFTAPLETGGYRLFVYALDGKNHAATANIPFYVE